MEEEKQRTTLQNKALYKFFELVAEQLNDAGLDMRRTLKKGIDIPWNKDRIKEFLWKPFQDALLKKKSTTELTTTEIDEVYEVFNRHFGEKFGIHQPFPSIDEIKLKLDEIEKEKKKRKDTSTIIRGEV